MSGTTLCPHCNTRFRIAGEQLEAHQGMVRCGHCMQAFDARPGFIPDQPDPQLELPIVDQRVAPAAPPPSRPAATPPAEQPPVTTPEPETAPQPEEPRQQEPTPEETKPEEPQAEAQGAAEPEAQTTEPAEQGKDQTAAEDASATEETPHEGSLDFVPSVEASADESQPKPLVIQSSLAGLDAEEDAVEEPKQPGRRWPWVVGVSLLALLMLLQGLYFFRVELAVRLPGLKPMLVGYCELLACTVPLPRNVDLMSIESSELQADLQHANQITLIALLRNRASHVQAFPVLELSLNDTEDKVLARRLFKPADYLPATESDEAGLRPNREISVRLKLDTTDLRPTGYRLALFYPQ